MLINGDIIRNIGLPWLRFKGLMCTNEKNN